MRNSYVDALLPNANALAPTVSRNVKQNLHRVDAATEHFDINVSSSTMHTKTKTAKTNSVV